WASSHPDDGRHGIGLVYCRSASEPHWALPSFSDCRGRRNDSLLRGDRRNGARPLVAARYVGDCPARLLLWLAAPLGNGGGAERARFGGYWDRPVCSHVLSAYRRGLWRRSVDSVAGGRP